jgi:hypothetical protein
MSCDDSCILKCAFRRVCSQRLENAAR